MTREDFIDPAKRRYQEGAYCTDFGDDEWKAAQMDKAIRAVPELANITSYTDIGCGAGGVTAELVKRLKQRGVPLVQVVAYDIAPISEEVRKRHAGIEFRQRDFLDDDCCFDLITLNDVVEHMTCPQDFLRRIADRANYVALHMPLDDRLSVLLANQYNYRIGPIGHLNFWRPATALNLLTASGLLPLHCQFTPGFMFPSGRVRLIQRLAWPLRYLLWKLNPPLTSVTIGGVGFAVVCKGRKSR